jgi:hypothetical protein
MLLEGCLQLWAAGGLDHPWKCFDDLTLCVIDVLELVDEQII